MVECTDHSLDVYLFVEEFGNQDDELVVHGSDLFGPIFSWVVQGIADNNAKGLDPIIEVLESYEGTSVDTIDSFEHRCFCPGVD